MNEFVLNKNYNEPKEKYNLVSIVIFKPKTTYKRFMFYVNGINYLINNLHQYLPSFYLRLYYDESVLGDFE